MVRRESNFEWAGLPIDRFEQCMKPSQRGELPRESSLRWKSLGLIAVLIVVAPKRFARDVWP
jgi:hypothetical protein